MANLIFKFMLFIIVLFWTLLAILSMPAHANPSAPVAVSQYSKEQLEEIQKVRDSQDAWCKANPKACKEEVAKQEKKDEEKRLREQEANEKESAADATRYAERVQQQEAERQAEIAKANAEYDAHVAEKRAQELKDKEAHDKYIADVKERNKKNDEALAHAGEPKAKGGFIPYLLKKR